MTSENSQDVLVVPRDVVSILGGFVPWWAIDPVTMAALSASYDWSPRLSAERSSDLVQLIACAVVRDVNGNYSVSRRIGATRKDLHWKLTLLYGGHVERVEDSLDLTELLQANLLRELSEEIGVSDVDKIEIVGTVNDLTNLASSRHIAIVFNVSTSGEVSVQAGEEFSLGSEYCGEFLDSAGLAPLEHRFDPWSRLLFHNWISPDSSGEVGLQLGLMIDTE